jgi:hypothetical protein
MQQYRTRVHSPVVYCPCQLQPARRRGARAWKELQTVVAERVISAEVRRRSWRVQILQNRIDAMLALSEARAREYAADPGGSSGLLVKDYRGKDANQ